MRDLYISIFRKSIQRKRYSLILAKIKITTIDIEVASENGFPDVESAAEEILLITLQDYNTKQIRTWGLGPFNNKQENVIYKGFQKLSMNF